jgi:hypothetical protein
MGQRAFKAMHNDHYLITEDNEVKAAILLDSSGHFHVGMFSFFPFIS